MVNKSLAILASGTLGLKVIQSINEEYHIDFIATDNKSDNIIAFANKNKIPLFTGKPRKERLYNFLKNHTQTSEILLSINYLFIVESDVLKKFKYPVNFHGSLLPKYRGRTPHVWAIINNEIKTGITAHLMDDGCDTGDILLQREIEIRTEDTGASLLSKFNCLYPDMVKEVLMMINSQQITLAPQEHSKATKYGKRTPQDGKIDWDWHRERIFNWVRALSDPYPGAFCLYKNEKIVIDKVCFSDMGYDNEVRNGTFLTINPKLIIKTGNGALEITQLRKPKSVFFELNTSLE